MSLDFSNWLRDDAHAHARRRLCRDRHAGMQRASSVVRPRLLRVLVARVRSLARPGAVALVADVVMVSVAAAVALVAAQSIVPEDTSATVTSHQLHRIGETP
jgi:hypothetical protein